ncbi:hypothetical protein EYE40_07665 [Glaciihabitans arcticus]|uniref:Uncharacterized protein n=1 Tax=Glaciihabitans arcticus TaxID=2668039 RepID=A0A4Q9GRU8_9MICO|nr:hypothetical protein [Glaciihabitans arcticus]TBN57285.1 hypothetical protein EYE40_07665 [Glaciihabitans arcticus]
MSRREPLPPHLSGVPFAVSTAIELGLSRDSLRRSDLVSPFHGVRAPLEPMSTSEQLCRAYASRMHPNNAFSHWTAGELWGAPFPVGAVRGGIHVIARKPRRAPEGVGVIGHRADLADDDVVLLRGLPVCSAAVT